jgi:hypothetical protein
LALAEQRKTTALKPQLAPEDLLHDLGAWNGRTRRTPEDDDPLQMSLFEIETDDQP